MKKKTTSQTHTMLGIPKILADYYYVVIDKKYKTEKTKAGVITISEAYIDEEDSDRYIHRTIKGEVIGVPMKFSKRDAYPIDIGMPQHVISRSGDQIEGYVKMGNTRFSASDYRCTPYERYPTVTMDQVGKRMDLVEGDIVYFDHRNTDDEDRAFSLPDGRSVFKMDPTTIICAVREGEIKMQGGWTIVKPNMETWDEITTEAGIVMKPKPEAKYLEGIMMYTNSKDFGNPGDIVLYLPDSDWELEIEGKKHFIIIETDILGMKKAI